MYLQRTDRLRTISRSSSESRRDGTPGCISRADIFQHRLMEEPPNRSATRGLHEQYQTLVRDAKSMCDACPIFTECLYDAVARHDVSGYVAGTTVAQRRQIRHLLNVEVQADDFDQLVGARAARRPVSHDEVLRLRNTYPNDSLESLALRLGCSLSTVKRHLRRARRGQSPVSKPQKARPTVAMVLQAYETIVSQVRPLRPRRSRVA